jgi:hypothetical protein
MAPPGGNPTKIRAVFIPGWALGGDAPAEETANADIATKRRRAIMLRLLPIAANMSEQEIATSSQTRHRGIQKDTYPWTGPIVLGDD